MTSTPVLIAAIVCATVAFLWCVTLIVAAVCAVKASKHPLVVNDSLDVPDWLKP